MPISRTGISTGLLGYTLRKEFLADTLFYKETEVFNLDIYACNMTGTSYSPAVIHQNITNEFSNRYSGDINVKVFQVPGDYYFPNDSVRASKFNVQVEIQRVPSGVSGSQLELSGSYYKGLDANFFNSYAPILIDFREDFDFEETENGNQTFTHNVAFSIMSGNSRAKAVEIASGLFANDKDTTFGITAMAGQVTVANTTNFQNYFTETYDTFRNTYSFTKRRELLPLSGSTYLYNLNHVLDFREDGVFDITERGSVKGTLSYSNAQNGLDILLSGAYIRCNSFYTTYKDLAGGTTISAALVANPTRISKLLNKLAISTEYEIGFTNNPNFSINGTTRDEVMEMNVDEKNYIDMNHRFTFSTQRRGVSPPTIISLLNEVYASSPTTASGYYAATPSFYNANLPIKQVKYDMSWPSNRNKATATFEYTNNPRNFVTINGTAFYSLDYHVQDTRPVDIITEYKVINRTNQLSVINYAYQTERGEIAVTIEAGIGRNPNEFASGFRSNITTYLTELYKYGVALFMQQFKNTIPLSFTYYLADIRYGVNSDGVISMHLSFTYTLKKHMV